MVFIVADNSCQGDPENAARKILQDFRSGRMGPISLQCAPEREEDDGHARVDSLKQEGLHSIHSMSANDVMRVSEEMMRRQQEEIEERAAAARESAKTKGLELPPVVEEALVGGEDESLIISKPSEDEVGKGMFDGW